MSSLHNHNTMEQQKPLNHVCRISITVILMKYWSVFIFYGDDFICLFNEWRYFNEVLIRFTVTSLSVFLRTTSVESLLHHYYRWTFTSFCFWTVKTWEHSTWGFLVQSNQWTFWTNIKSNGLFNEWRYFNEVLIRFTVTNLSVCFFLWMKIF
jgi:hypothetical protein